MAGKFELYADKAGEIRFRLKASNGQVILASEGYKSKASAKKGIASVQKNCADDTRFERKETKSGKPMFNLRATNGQVIGTSETYESFNALESGIAAVKRAAPFAQVIDVAASIPKSRSKKTAHGEDATVLPPSAVNTELSRALDVATLVMDENHDLLQALA
jgi:uncharacterized protein YegP (UPF0339 family)